MMQPALASERLALRAVWSRKDFWLLHVLVNAMLVAMIYAWVSIPDQTVTDLLLSALFGLFIILFALWFHGSTLALFRARHVAGDGSEPKNEARVRNAFRRTLPRLPALALWGLIVVAAVGLIFRAGNYERPASIWIASALTFRLRRPIRPDTIANLFSTVLLLAGWGLPLLLLLPFGTQVASEGFGAFGRRGLSHVWRALRRKRYWVEYVVLFAIGAVLPYRLVFWVPQVNGLFNEAASMAGRFLLAYLLAVSSWLVLASALGLGLDGSSQTER